MAEVISQRVQDSFVLLAITDTRFLELSRKTIKPEYFSSQVTEDVVKICYSYFDQFHEAPNNHFHDEVVRFLYNKDERETDRYLTYLEKLQKLPKPNQDYVIRRINNFVQAREFENAAIEFVKLTEHGNFTQAKELMQKTLRVGIAKESVGLKYFEEDIPTYYGDLQLREKLIGTGFPILDRYLKGLKRGQLICVLGGYKGKRSWMCIHLVMHALLSGKSVLHISHEMTLGEVEERYDMMLGGLTNADEAKLMTYKEIDESGRLSRVWEEEAATVYNKQAVSHTRESVKKLGGQLIIKKYPMGTCTMEELDRYLDYLETYEGFIPDVLINDYVEIMKLPLGQSSAMRDRINQAYIDHKRIADERNIVVITVSQAVRSALRKAQLSQKDFAEDIRKLGNVDIVLALSETDEQAQQGMMRVFVLANRSGPQDFGCMFSTNLDVGQFCTDCWPIRRQNEEGEDEPTG